MAIGVRLRDVHKSFGAVEAVRGVDLTIRAGEVVGFLGPNGTGKTSTIDIILGLSQPTSGAVEVYGMSPRRAITKGLVSAVMQTRGLLKDLTVQETVLYTSKRFAVSRPVGEVLERAGITRIADRLVGKCSGGEQQRLRFAMALLPDPELLLLDEPTQGMDVEGRRDFWPAIRDDVALGLFIGYLLPSENVTQIIALVLMVCCFAGGLFIPVSKFPHTYATLAKFTPLYGLNELVHYPLVSSHFEWVLNLPVWLAAFVLGAVWQFRRDTARV